MSFLAPLLEIQALDLVADAARKRIAELPERKLLPKLAARVAAIEAELEAARAERTRMEKAEEELGRAVAQIARDIEAAEVERYSGKRMDRDKAAAHDASQEALREKQASFETEEMSLLEEMEAVESKIETHLTQKATLLSESEQVADALRKGEAEGESELEGLATSRAALAGSVPEPIMSAYERLRAQPRSGGRGATAFVEGNCTGCRIQLPSLERSRMLAEPEDALIQCPQCRRVLVR